VKTILNAVIVFLALFHTLFGQAVLVHNTLQEIEASKGKLKLKLIRIWGGDEEEDENKFFMTPSSIVIDDNKLVYISDTHGQCIKVFDLSGKYLRTIGRKGRGPGDVYGPNCINISIKGDLVVNEWGGRRIQWFNTKGESKGIINSKYFNRWFALTSKDEVAVYGTYDTFLSKKLLTIYNRKGKVLREIGRYHDKSKSFLGSEKLCFTMDDSDNIYAANACTPVIRKYSPDGKLLKAITFETPFEILVKISLNSMGDEIERIEESESQERFKIKKNRKGIEIQEVKKKHKVGIINGISVDSQKRLYIIIPKRHLTKKEMMATAISGNVDVLNRERVDFDIVENIDVNRLLVFNQAGKVIAETPMTTFCDGIYIKDKSVFIIDGLLNQRILEYEMSIEK
jgi:hypothetical protein